MNYVDDQSANVPFAGVLENTLQLHDAGGANATARPADGQPKSRKTPPTKREESDADQLYLREINEHPLLTADEERTLVRAARDGDAEARQRMIESNLRLVVKIARRYMNRGLPLLDLVEEGNLGLIHSIGKFDPDRGFRFSTYATWWIRQTIERALMSQCRTIRLPIHVTKAINRYRRVARELNHSLGRTPTLEEIAGQMDCSVTEIARMQRYNERVTSLDLPISPDGEGAVLDLVPDPDAPEPATAVADADIFQHIEHSLDELCPRQQAVVIRRFGLRGHEPSTLDRIGTELGITRERVRQIQICALQRLQQILETRGLSTDALFSP